VRGAAGTGKTVVGLHRAAWLADQARHRGEQPRILFTTFIKSLPPVFESLYLRMPGTRAGDVEFLHIDKLARDVCKAAGDRLVTAPREIDAAFAKAFKRHVFPGTPLHEAGFSRDYLREEITSVIKGRGIEDLDSYLEIERTGRRAPMGRNQRTQVWELMLEWYEEMGRRGTVDFSDAILRARDHARTRTEPSYTAALIDEAQDLTLVGLQLVRALVNGSGPDRPNGLVLLGDGAQRIYPGGFNLRQAGIEVRGRTTVLKQNYRNTAEIIRTALTVGGASTIEDLGEEYRRGDADAETGRRGSPPELVEAVDLDGQYDAVCKRIHTLATDEQVGVGDIGVLVPTNRMVKAVGNRLDEAGFAWENLDHYDGRPNENVKVGTYHRGKGLEFKVVLLPGLSKSSFPRPPQPLGPPVEQHGGAGLGVGPGLVAPAEAGESGRGLESGQTGCVRVLQHGRGQAEVGEGPVEAPRSPPGALTERPAEPAFPVRVVPVEVERSHAVRNRELEQVPGPVRPEQQGHRADRRPVGSVTTSGRDPEADEGPGGGDVDVELHAAGQLDGHAAGGARGPVAGGPEAGVGIPLADHLIAGDERVSHVHLRRSGRRRPAPGRGPPAGRRRGGSGAGGWPASHDRRPSSPGDRRRTTPPRPPPGSPSHRRPGGGSRRRRRPGRRDRRGRARRGPRRRPWVGRATVGRRPGGRRPRRAR